MKKLALLICLLFVLSLIGCGAKSSDPETTTPSGETQEAESESDELTDIEFSSNDVFCKASYAATGDEIAQKADLVVATAGDRELTLGELQLHYINSIYAFYSQNYYYMSMLGLDLSAALDQQRYPGDENMTWEQFFLNAALTSWQNYAAAETLAERDGFILAPAQQSQVDNMAAQLESIATSNGYENVQDYLNAEMAPGVTPQTYIDFNRAYIVSNEYIGYLYENLYPTSEEISLYYEQNQAVLNAEGITDDMGLVSSVRHLLIQPKGGTADESGTITYSEEEWAAALSEAERILVLWKEGEATEESFAELANTYSEDGGSNTTGGLYEQIHINASYVPEFKSWAADSSRKPGDVEIVQTAYGYHIMYFVSGESYMENQVGERMITERVQEKLLAVKEELPAKINYKEILLYEEPVV